MKYNFFLMVLVVISLFLVSCQQTNVTDSDSTKQKESNSIIEKVTDTFSSDAIKLKKEFFKLNDENLTFFTDATILKEGGGYENYKSSSFRRYPQDTEVDTEVG